ncbi:MAG: PadR family transcriptional regulator [Acidimicrobiales bacterium]
MSGVFLDKKLLILISLLEGPKHGYALMKDIEISFGVRIGPGTLYGCVGSLEREGLVESLPESDRRRPYKITALGEARAKANVAEIAQFTSVALSRVALL